MYIPCYSNLLTHAVIMPLKPNKQAINIHEINGEKDYWS